MDQICRAFVSGTTRGWPVLVALAMVCYAYMATATTSSTNQCSWSYLSDGYCDSANNNFDCDYDGGDCCKCTCVDGPYYSCGVSGYYCLDPSADCDYYYYYYYYYYYTDDGDDDYYVTDDGDGGDDDDDADDDYFVTDDGDDDDDDYFVTDYGDDGDDDYYVTDDGDDGHDDYYVTDDGDDVLATDDDDDKSNTETSMCTYSLKSDGKCNSENNNDVCDYDGGDCCKCTCEDDTYTCGSSGYDCLDPSGCPSGGNDSNLAVIIGATVGSLAVLGIAIAAVAFFYCRKVRAIGYPAHQAEHAVNTEPNHRVPRSTKRLRAAASVIRELMVGQ